MKEWYFDQDLLYFTYLPYIFRFYSTFYMSVLPSDIKNMYWLISNQNTEKYLLSKVKICVDAILFMEKQLKCN